MKKHSISSGAVKFLGLGAIIAVLAPMSVVAATGNLKLVDGNGTSKAQVDGGSLRVGDGSGAITVDGTGAGGRVPVAGNVDVPDGVSVKGAVNVNGAVSVPGGVGINGAVSTTSQPTTMLAQGDCDSTDAYTQNGTIASGKTVVGIVLSDDHGGSQLNTLTVTAPSSTNTGNRLFTLADGQGFASGYAQFGNSADFGPGLKLSEAWSISCTGQPGSSQGNGLWIAYGY